MIFFFLFFFSLREAFNLQVTEGGRFLAARFRRWRKQRRRA